MAFGRFFKILTKESTVKAAFAATNVAITATVRTAFIQGNEKQAIVKPFIEPPKIPSPRGNRPKL